MNKGAKMNLNHMNTMDKETLLMIKEIANKELATRFKIKEKKRHTFYNNKIRIQKRGY